MRVACYDTAGPARDVLRLVEWPDPQPGPGEVRVRLRWSGVNPSDVKSRAGLRSKALPFAQIVPHSDGMGVIDAVGAGVDAARLGERVWTWNAAWGRPGGTAAQYTVLPDAQAIALPDGVPDEAGACLGIPGLTALHALLTQGGVAGQRVLVAGGAGAVGHYAIQFARLLGAAQVIATVSGAGKAAIATAAGADATVNYREADAAEQIRAATGGAGVDRVVEVDIGANAELDQAVLRTGGTCVAYGSSTTPLTLPFYPLIAQNLTLQFFIVYHLSAADRARAQATLTGYLRRGLLQHAIGARGTLEGIVDAHEALEQGRVVGNLVLAIP